MRKRAGPYKGSARYWAANPDALFFILGLTLPSGVSQDPQFSFTLLPRFVLVSLPGSTCGLWPGSDRSHRIASPEPRRPPNSHSPRGSLPLLLVPPLPRGAQQVLALWVVRHLLAPQVFDGMIRPREVASRFSLCLIYYNSRIFMYYRRWTENMSCCCEQD